MADKRENKIVGSGPGEEQARTAEQYWTTERMAAAKPMPMRKGQKGAGAAEVKPEGKEGSLAPGHPKNHERGATAKQFEPNAKGGNAVNNPLAYPYSVCGKLYLTQNGSDFTGSASVVGKNVLLTAGHCVFEDGHWSTNLAFFPSYPKRPTSDPFYKFNWSYEAAWTAWTQNSDSAYDYGFIWVNSAPGNDLGWLGMLWNASTSGRTWDAVGYPGTPNPPFNGNVMDESIGTVASGTVSGTIGLTNDNMEHGSSGGPWITDYNGSPREYANGLQSFHIHDGDFTEYGPYFTQDVKGLFDWISNPTNRH